MNAPRQLFCYSPRPVHAQLDPMAAAVLMLMRESRGVFRVEGQRATAIHRELRRRLLRAGLTRITPNLLTRQAVVGALCRLRNLDLVQRNGGAWRVARR